ncbi:MAG: hypothetical protein KF773_01000 [Deltaproteobacteria bacterium]|nr:hypothetical protein [Deltaproteobacteria bacterium]MCW5800766.1 hypothetical protein [Deltaproteobacteria bacterium]
MLFAGGSALAGPALDDGKSASPNTDSTLTPPGMAPDKEVEYGIGIRVRNVRVPKGELELFLERAGDTGASNLGFGIDLTRRRGNVELQLGIEFEHINPGEGVWIESGKNVAAGDEADYVLSPEHAPRGENLGWLTFEFTFLNHAPITKNISIRYGAGAGIGLVYGNLYHHNITCVGATNDMPDPGCKPMRFGGRGIDTDGAAAAGTAKYNLPPVFPVVNAIIGVQLKPFDKMTVNIEGGIRTFLFFGMSSSYFF